MFYIYAISSWHRNYLYVGMTTDIERRIERHNQGREKTPRAYRPFELIHKEIVVGDRAKARNREKYWKSGIGKATLRQIRDKKILP